MYSNHYNYTQVITALFVTDVAVHTANAGGRQIPYIRHMLADQIITEQPRFVKTNSRKAKLDSKWRAYTQSKKQPEQCNEHATIIKKSVKWKSN